MAGNGTAQEAADEKVSILVVDDRPDKLLAIEALLAELNQNIVRANSGKEALRALLKQDFAVILLDVNMPGMDGFETAALIRQRARSETTPIIFISAVNDTENHVSRGYSLGAVDYILTPVVPEILRAKIAVFVDLYKKTEQIKRQAEERAEFLREQAARAEAEARQERLAFLAEASNVLAGSLEYHETFQNLADIVVPRLADFCVVHVADDARGLRQVAVTHREFGDAPKLKQLADRYPSSVVARQVSNRAFTTGRSEMQCDLDQQRVAELFAEERDQALLEELAACSYIAVPLSTGDAILGVVTMLSTGDGRPCGPNELSLAEELVHRAALAVENARLYKAAQKARAEAERANAAKDQFLAMLSHELRTPLTPVLTSLLALERDDRVIDGIRPALEMIRRNVELEARLIDDLLDLTRVSKGKVQLNVETVDAHKLLRNALEICQSDIEQKQLALSLELGAQKVQLDADPARVQQIFWNLIKNAVKFTAERGRLDVRTLNDGDELRVEISDNGVGIDAESLPKIFDAFEQGERMRFGGLGLGLAISKALVETHGGRITAESAGPNRGAKFTLVFPLSTAKERARPSRSGLPFPRRSMRILLVEDHVDTNRSLTNLLRSRGYRVTAAHSVQSALEVAAAERFDVLVSDIGLPDGSGTELIQKLGGDRPAFRVALSGFGMEEDIRRSRESGFDHHLIKPVDLNKLDAILQDAAVNNGVDLSAEPATHAA
jgi:signal transduction histidine kinase/DNA-binding response OmpR family regulator